jgi:predicted DsbA family dithiol-disulfide isomerase
MNKKINKRIGIIFFIGVSLAALVLFWLFGYYFTFNRSGMNEASQEKRGKSRSSERFYLNKNFRSKDDLVTKVPNLEDMLTGPIITDADPSMGDKYAPVVIVYFADFECQYCQKQEQKIKKLITNYKYKTRFIWKDYPENKEDSLSFQAAVAARCAQEQGKFWQFHDFLYEFGQLNQETYLKIADILKLDKNKFTACIESDRPRALIKDNIDEGNALDIGGVPFVYINDQQIMGEFSYEDLERVVKIELKREKK